MTLINLDQALRDILADEFRTGGYTTGAPHEEMQGLVNIALSAMRRAYRLAESKDELTKMLGEPPAPQA